MIDIYDLIGLAGVILSIYCYARVQWHRDYAKRIEYSLINLIGASFLMYSLYVKWNLAAFVCNAVWAAISLYGLFRCYKYIKKPVMPPATHKHTT